MSQIKSIAVVGATGMLGMPVAEELFRAGYRVRAIVRNLDKARTRLPEGVEVVEGNLRDKESLVRGFKAADAVYVSLTTYPGEKNAGFQTEYHGIQHIIDAAQQAGIKRIGYLSSMVKDFKSIDWWVFDIKNRVCSLLMESSIPVSIYYASNFFENLSELQLVGNRVMLAGEQVTQSWWIGARDFGKQVARDFGISGADNREYTIQGPEPYNFEEAAEVFIEGYKPKKLKQLKAPLWIFKVLGSLSKEMNFQYHILYAINHFDEQFQSEDTWRRLGKPQTTLTDFASSF